RVARVVGGLRPGGVGEIRGSDIGGHVEPALKVEMVGEGGADRAPAGDPVRRWSRLDGHIAAPGESKSWGPSSCLPVTTNGSRRFRHAGAGFQLSDYLTNYTRRAACQ